MTSWEATYAAAQWYAGFSWASPPHSSGSGYAASCSLVSLSPWKHLLGREELIQAGPTSPEGFWFRKQTTHTIIRIHQHKWWAWWQAWQLWPEAKLHGSAHHLKHLFYNCNLNGHHVDILPITKTAYTTPTKTAYWTWQLLCAEVYLKFSRYYKRLLGKQKTIYWILKNRKKPFQPLSVCCVFRLKMALIWNNYQISDINRPFWR